MILTGKKLAAEIKNGNSGNPAGLVIVPEPSVDAISHSGESSINLRLGRWFLAVKQSNETHLEATSGDSEKVQRVSKQFFVPFGGKFILHPGRFVLAATLEWIRLPTRFTAFVVGKSSLGRRGIIIETAAGVHPGFSGCLTLEVANVGELPVEMMPGMLICQLFVHTMDGDHSSADTPHAGQRKPRLGVLREDPVLERLKKSVEL